jgi:S1-C subfamily serine protease
MLTPEEKQRIEDEERKRTEEEQYRAQVRRELAGQHGAARPPKSNKLKSLLIVGGIAAVLCAGALVVRLRKGPVPNSPTTESMTSTKAPAVVPAAPIGSRPKPSALAPPTPVKLTTAQIAELATPSVVIVENYNEDGEKAGQGSGYVVSSDGVVITNYHVIRGAKWLAIRQPAKDPQRTDSLLGYSIEHDVAAIQVSAGSFPALSTEATEQVKVGDHVTAIGAPLGLENTVSEGIVSAVREGNGIHIIQTTASISPGSSGGPLLNDSGKVIGLTTAQMLNGQNLNFVVSSRHIADLLNQKRQVSLSDLLNETRVTDPLPASTISVAARNAVQLSFSVNGQQGATLEGAYTVSGGRGGDIGVMLVGPGGAMIVNSGRVSGSGQFKKRLPRGQYAIIFDNRFSTFSPKSVSPDLKLVYYR